MNLSRSYHRLVRGIFTTLVVLFASQHHSAIAQTSPINLTGTSWKLISSGNSEELSEPLGGTTITAQFDENQVRGSGSCNSYRATYQTNDDMLTIGPAAATKRGCAPEILEQESRYFRDLAGVQRYQLNEQGQLEIYYQTDSENGVLIFANAEISTVDLTGTSWKLVQFGTPDNLSEPITGLGGRNITARFTENRVAGSGSCNFYSGSYQTSGDVLQVNPRSFISTLIGCPTEISSQEERYFAALVGAQNYRVNELGQLEISYQTETQSGVLIFDESQ